MENRSFEGDGAVGGRSTDDNSGPSRTKPETGLGASRGRHTPEERASGSSESPKAYQQRYMTSKPEVDLSLEYPEPPTLETRDERSNPEFLRQSNNRKERRRNQLLTEGTCALRPDPPNLPVRIPEPYSDEPALFFDLNPDPIVNLAADANLDVDLAADANLDVDLAADANLDADPLADDNLDADPAADDNRVEDVASALTRQNRFLLFKERVSAFSFQFPFHILQMTWPLATAVMGVVNLNICFMNRFFPYVMISVGLLGTLALLLRLYMIYCEKCFESHPLAQHYWVALRVLEFIVLDFFVAQLVYFFEQAPSSSPEDSHYCKPRFYKINCGLMLVTSVTLLGWIVVYIAKALRMCRRRFANASS